MRADKKKNSRPAAAIVMCFCLMALVSIFAVKAGIDKVKDSMKTADVVKKQAVESETKAPEVVDSLENSTDAHESDTSSGSAHIYHIFPVEGEIIKEHSTDMPIYWKTLDQYMTHSGIDIAAEIGTPVQASAGGTVTKIEETSSMGITVEINHGNGLISIYSNLSDSGLIELGEVVTQGTVIGQVGQSALFESEDPEHLHFEMKKNNEPVNPEDFLK